MPLHVTPYSLWLRAAGSSDATVERRSLFLRWAADHLPAGLHAASTEQLASLMAGRSWARWTRRTYDGHLRGYYHWAKDNGLRPDNPMDLLRRPPQGSRVPRPISEDELHRLLNSTPPPFPLVWLLATFAGLRCSEIANLQRADISEESMRILGKGSKVRIVPTHPAVWAAVAKLGPGPVILDRYGRQMTGAQLSARSSELIARLDLRGIYLHRGRHRFATEVYRATGDLVVLQQLLGHASVMTTTNYTLVGNDRHRAAVQALPGMGNRATVDGPVPAAGKAA